MPVENVKYTQPLLGNSTSNPLYTESTSGVTDGTLKKTMVADMSSQELLAEVLKQLHIMNLHLAILTDNYIQKQDVEI